jgi:hypothetical protein
LLATAPRLDWAKLLRRRFAIDALRCGHCGGRLRLLAAITDRATARKIWAWGRAFGPRISLDGFIRPESRANSPSRP